MQDVSVGKYIFFEWQSALKLNSQLALMDYKKYIHISDRVLRSYLNAFYLNKLSPLVGRLDIFPFMCKEGGLDKIWESRATYQLKKKLNLSLIDYDKEHPEGINKKLSLKHLTITIIVILTGYVLAAIVLMKNILFS